MSEYFFRVGDHEIAVRLGRWGRVRIFHDGREIDTGRSLYGRWHHKSVEVDEDGPVVYDFGIRLWGPYAPPRIEIRRAGQAMVGWRP